jgi:hypothetical protein
MTEYKFQVTIVPEDYDYNEEEIIYRIYFEDQLISERSLPVLQTNQGIVDTFFINLPDSNTIKNILFKNCKLKNAKIKKISVNDFSIDSGYGKIQFGNFFVRFNSFLNK